MSEKTAKMVRRVIRRNQRKIIKEYLIDLKKARFKEKIKWCFELLFK